MTLTKITRIEWASPQDQSGNLNLDLDREYKIEEMVSAGKTDGFPIEIAETITERYWIDEPSAQEYIDFIFAKTTEYNITVPTATILNVP